MKTIAIALRTEPIKDLTLLQASLLEEILMDKRLKRAEAIKAFLTSDAYQEKKAKYQRGHAEFGEVSEIAITDGKSSGSKAGEVEAIEYLEEEIRGAGRLVGFDLYRDLHFILRRSMLTGQGESLRLGLFTYDGTATTALIDIKKAWAKDDRSYANLTLEQLCVFRGASKDEIPITAEDEAIQTMWLYRQMQGVLL